MGLDAPEDLSRSDRAAFERGWSSLREGQLEAAASAIENLARRYGASPEIQTAAGFLELRLGNREAAEESFQRALGSEPGFGPAQSGYFLSALAAGEEERALERLSRLEEHFPQHELVDRHGTMLRVNVAEARLRTARELVRDRQYEEAASAYLKALEIAPEAGSLYLEAAEAELQGGLSDRAAVHALRATELEPGNVEAHELLAEARYRSGDLVAAVQALRTAASLRPFDRGLRSRLEEREAELREVTLPPEYMEIEAAKRLTREQLAALLAVELRSAFDAADVEPRRVIAIDIAESWALEYIRRTVGADVLEVFSNHTFHPQAFVTRIELASALARALEVLAPEIYESARRSSLGREFPDVSRENVNYEAAAISTALGLLETGEGGAFELREPVSGAEAAAAVRALEAHMTP